MKRKTNLLRHRRKFYYRSYRFKDINEEDITIQKPTLKNGNVSDIFYIDGEKYSIIHNMLYKGTALVS